MKILTIRQPWLRAITHGDKRTENRGREPSPSLIGKRIGLHAATKFDELWSGNADVFAKYKPADDNDWFLGHIVSTALLVGFVRCDDFGGYCLDYAPKHYNPMQDKWLVTNSGNVGWLFDDIRLLTVALPARGYPWLWDSPLSEEDAS